MKFRPVGRLLGLGSALILLTSCSPRDCLQAVLPSIAVTVVDAATGANLAAITTGTMTQGSFSASFARSGELLLAGQNHSGTFTVALAAPGYQSWQGEVYVEPYGCIIQTRELRVELEPE